MKIFDDVRLRFFVGALILNVPRYFVDALFTHFLLVRA